MKNRFFAVMALTLSLVFSAQAQESKEKNNSDKGLMAAVTTKSFSFDKDGVKIPYQVTIQENRKYTAKFDENDKGKVDQDRLSTPAYVTKLITVVSEHDATFNRRIVLRYPKQVTDTFELVSTENGFAVKVDDKSMNYIFGEGIYFANTPDGDFFTVDLFDYML